MDLYSQRKEDFSKSGTAVNMIYDFEERVSS